MNAPTTAAYDLIDQAIYAVTTNHNHDALVILAKLKEAWRTAQHEAAEAAVEGPSPAHAAAEAERQYLTALVGNRSLAEAIATADAGPRPSLAQSIADDQARDHRHGLHTRAPLPTCQSCVETQNGLGLRSGSTTCYGSYTIVAPGEYRRQEGNGAWAITTCPACSHRVGATRPTKRVPWTVVGRHDAGWAKS